LYIVYFVLLDSRTSNSVMFRRLGVVGLAITKLGKSMLDAQNNSSPRETWRR
jgi:hypothetical protein